MSTSACRRLLPALALIAGLAGCSGYQTRTGAYIPEPAALARQPIAQASTKTNGSIQPDAGEVRIFTASRDTDALLAFNLKAKGNVAPARTIASYPNLSDPDALAIDGNGDLYAANDGGNQVFVFAKDDNGDVKPMRTIGGSKSQLGPTEGIMVDPSDNLWVSNYVNSAITEYKAGASGNVKPIATIGGTNTHLDGPCGLAMNTNQQLFAANIHSASIVVFAKGANGNATPLGVIGGSKTGLIMPFALAFDKQGRLRVADESAGVLVFANGALGNVAPVQKITGLAYPAGVAGDSAGHIWAADFSEDSIDEYASDADGNATPIRTIAGSKTTINGANYLVFQK